MQIQKIFIRNFRSIGEKGLELSFPIGSSILIGENNVGKSSIFEAIKMMINLEVLQKIPWDIENWYASDQNRSIELILTISFNDEDISKITPIFEPLKISNDTFKDFFSNQLVYRIIVKTPDDRPESYFIFGPLTIYNNVGRLGNFEGKVHSYGIPWEAVVEHWDGVSIEEPIRKYFEKQWSPSLNKDQNAKTFDISLAGMSYRTDLSKSILDLLKEDIIFIEEFREKPKKELKSSLVSPTGVNLASILFNLKNGRPREREKFERIKRDFHDIFPNLNLDIIKEGEEIKIHTQKSSIESTTHFLGAGILETLLLITHVVVHKDRILLVDHPELHLHPHAERNLATLIDESEGNQILLISHSPYFIKIDKRHKIFRFVQKNSETEIFTMPAVYLTDIDYLKLEHLLDIDSKELFFAKKVLLVEGPTEYGAIPVFARGANLSFDKYGISIIDVGGKSNFSIFARLCEGFHIPYMILADGDAREMLKQIKVPYKSKRKRLFILSKDFEALLPEDLVIEARQIVGNSKPRVGKYVATEMLNRPQRIPSSIYRLFFKLTRLAE